PQQFTHTLVETDRGLESSGVNTIVADVVIALVLILLEIGEVQEEIELRLQMNGDVLFTQVELRRTNVEDLAGEPRGVLQSEQIAAADVANMHKSPAKRPLIDHEVALPQGAVSEIVNQQVQA